MTPPFGKCVWCGRDDFNVEHIIAKQVANVLKVPYPVQLHYGEYARGPEDGIEIALPERVCTTCNRRWMRKMDDRILKFMEPTLSKGAPVQLDAEQQLRLGAWAVKIGLLLQLWFHDEQLAHPQLTRPGALTPYVPDDNLIAFYRNQRRAPAGTRVWIGAMDNTPPVHATCSRLMVVPSGAPRPAEVDNAHGYFSLFGLRRLIVYVVGWNLDYERPSGIDADIDAALAAPDAMSLIWPSVSLTVSWPPPRELETADLALLAKRRPSWA